MKLFLRILKWIGISILGLILLVLLLLFLDRDATSVELTETQLQSIQARPMMDSATASASYSELMETYGHKKQLAPGFELQCLLALSFYPELKDAKISFLVEPAFLPLASRPEPVSVLLPWIERHYLVIISSASTNYFESILLKNIPFNEQVGIIGHELGHSLFYLDKSSLQLLQIAYRYQNNNDYRIQFERATDQRAVAHGLGYQLYDFAFFVRKAFGDSQEEISQEKGGMYLSPGELAREMNLYNFYQDPVNPPEHYFLNEN